MQTVAMIAAAVTLRFALFGCSGVAAHKGAYGALFKVRCMVAEHMARAPLGALNERRTGDIKTVLNEDIGVAIQTVVGKGIVTFGRVDLDIGIPLITRAGGISFEQHLAAAVEIHLLAFREVGLLDAGTFFE